MLSYTKQADVGLLLERSLGLSFTYALPNKLFDYIHAGLPIIASPLVEVKRIMDENEMGVIIENYNPKYLADTLNEMLNNAEKRKAIDLKKYITDIFKKYNKIAFFGASALATSIINFLNWVNLT